MGKSKSKKKEVSKVNRQYKHFLFDILKSTKEKYLPSLSFEESSFGLIIINCDKEDLWITKTAFTNSNKQCKRVAKHELMRLIVKEIYNFYTHNTENVYIDEVFDIQEQIELMSQYIIVTVSDIITNELLGEWEIR